MNKKDFERVTLNKVYGQIRQLIAASKPGRAAALDFETYRWILSQTDKGPKDYIKIFKFLPDDAKKNILTFLKYKNEKEFKAKFRKALNIYNQTVKRTQENNEAESLTD